MILKVCGPDESFWLVTVTMNDVGDILPAVATIASDRQVQTIIRTTGAMFLRVNVDQAEFDRLKKHGPPE